MSSMDWRTLQGLLLPEGRVRQVRRGGAVLWTSYHSMVRAKLKAYLFRNASARSGETAAAQGEKRLPVKLSAFGAQGTSSAAEAAMVWPVRPAPRAASLSVMPTKVEDAMEPVFFATAWSKARSLGASEVRFAKDMAATPVSRGSAPAASEQNDVPTIASEVHGPAAAPGQAERETEFILAAKSAAPTALPVGADGAVRMEPHTVGRAEKSAAAETAHSAAPDCECALAAPMSQTAAAVLPVLNCTASVRLAESWVYPTVLGWGCIYPLARVSSAQLYKTRTGGNGLELS